MPATIHCLSSANLLNQPFSPVFLLQIEATIHCLSSVNLLNQPFNPVFLLQIEEIHINRQQHTHDCALCRLQTNIFRQNL
ncbi:hypothetical protein SUGI_0040470 [Cryptomeria japonica]|nr:hypothetical protein SUGI_0040470 [Cryptomeria japonica]